MSSEPSIKQFCAELVRLDSAGVAEDRLVLATGFDGETLHAFRQSQEYKEALEAYTMQRLRVQVEARDLQEDVVYMAMRQTKRLLSDPNVDGDYALRAAAVAHRVSKPHPGSNAGDNAVVNINAPQGVVVMQLPDSVAKSIRGISPERIASQQNAIAGTEKFVGMSTSRDLKEFIGLASADVLDGTAAPSGGNGALSANERRIATQIDALLEPDDVDTML